MTSGSGRPHAHPNPLFSTRSESFFTYVLECALRTSAGKGCDSAKKTVHPTSVSCKDRRQPRPAFPTPCRNPGFLHFRKELTEKMRPLLRAAAAIPPLALRGDYWAPVTLLPYLVDALRHAGPGVQVILRLSGQPRDVRSS